MPAKLTKPMDGLRQTKAHRYATLWRIERTDGTVFRFTDHDTDLRFTYDTTEEVYKAAGGFASSAREKQAGVQEHNLEIMGVLSAAAITETDLRAGRYLEAKVVEILIDWKFPYAGYFTKNNYWVAGVTYTHESWRVQLSGLPTWLRREVGWVHDTGCRHELYDDLCQISKGAFIFGGTVSTVTDTRRKFILSGFTSAAGYFDYGVVEWLTGANAGYKSDVLLYLGGGSFELALFTPFAIQVGDTCNAVAGCDKLWTTCGNKFGNKVNFGGFPYMPGNDRVLRGPE